MPVISTRLRGERGFTLIEALVAMLAGVIVTGATFSILDISLKQTTHIADRVSADQRGRIGMEKILQELHSSCVSIGANPIQAESTGTNIKFLSRRSSSSEPYFTTMTEHEISLSGETLQDASYQSNGGSEAVKWKFPETPTSTATLLTGVTQSAKGATPLFQYYSLKYKEGKLQTESLKTPLTTSEVSETAQVTVSFTTASESGTLSGRPGDGQVELSDTVALRLTPTTEVGRNEPCE